MPRYRIVKWNGLYLAQRKFLGIWWTLRDGYNLVEFHRSLEDARGAIQEVLARRRPSEFVEEWKVTR